MGTASWPFVGHRDVVVKLKETCVQQNTLPGPKLRGVCPLRIEPWGKAVRGGGCLIAASPKMQRPPPCGRQTGPKVGRNRCLRTPWVLATHPHTHSVYSQKHSRYFY